MKASYDVNRINITMSGIKQIIIYNTLLHCINNLGTYTILCMYITHVCKRGDGEKIYNTKLIWTEDGPRRDTHRERKRTRVHVQQCGDAQI